jgi:hypothetical protein
VQDRKQILFHFIIIIINGSNALYWTLAAFQFFYPIHKPVGLFGRGIRPQKGLDLRTRQHKHRHPMKLKGFRLTQLYFNSLLLFYSNYALHLAVVRPSSSGNIYIGI